jgi:RNA polymerase sigma-70 factor (ECF subfamily)
LVILMAMSEASSTARQLLTSAPNQGASGDRLHALLSDHHGFVWRSLRRLGVSDNDVEDASQQVFLVAHRRLQDIAPASERAFLFQTVLRVAADWRRAHQRRYERPGHDLLDVPDVTANPEELLDQRRARALLDKALQGMPMELRAVFVLFELEELTMLEIANLSSIPPGTVASRLRRARQLFKEAVDRLTRAQPGAYHDRGRP